MMTAAARCWSGLIVIISSIHATHHVRAFSFSSSSSLLSRELFGPTSPSRRRHLRSVKGSSVEASPYPRNCHPQLESFSIGHRESINSIKRRYRRQSRGRGGVGGRSLRVPSALSSSSASESGGVAAANGVGDVAGDEDLVTKLRNENESLQEQLRLLQMKNDQLVQNQPQQQQQFDIAMQQQRPRKKSVAPYEQRLILEDFEGEGTPSVDARGGVVDGWNRRERRYTEPWDDVEGVADDDEIGLSSSSPETDDELCEYDGTNWGECPVEPDVTFASAVKSRAAWLVGLLALQSCSGFILAKNELLLQDHPVIVYFLTMLVGAGGNAGNQASVRVIRGLALGTLNPRTQNRFLSRELRMAFALSSILSVAGFLRAVAFHTPLPETLAVTATLSIIVFSSICLGAVLPLLLQRAGVDPAHSSTTIQVVMDILGVVLTVFVSTMVLDSVWGKMLIKALGHMGI